MSHTTSQTWLSDEAREFEAWVKIRDAMLHVSPKSPFTPKTFEDWIEHRIKRTEEDHGRLASQITTRRTSNDGGSKKRKREVVVPVGQVLGGKELWDGLALVLADESIWVPLIRYPTGRRRAPWPSYEELKHEGDDRNKSGYSRFPPLPRDPGNETVNWKQRAPLKQCQLDEVGRPVLAAGGVHDEYLESEMLQLLNESLLVELGM
ncbi:hypothetical protein FQN53_001313 [Emmonsiellopsis sp. PD_33]|nr:hypothetical protein FQN53_001313 [Emmonsiellopsis sp. PD_33]